MALIAERYKQIHKGRDPRADLLKGAVLNSAVDAGLPGPDFQFGFGIMNGEKALETIEKGYYRFADIAQGGEEVFEIDVPEGVRELKVMLVWHDAPVIKQYAYTDKVLVNDLDLMVDGKRPLVPEGAKGKVNLPASPRVDRLHNVEHVVIARPAAGRCKVSVQGHEVPEGSQRCVVVWYFEKNRLRLLYPGNDCHMPGESFQISVEGISGGGYRADLSYDGGKTFTNVGRVKQFNPLEAWTSHPQIVIPKDAPLTGEAVLRIICRDGASCLSAPFTIAPRPAALSLEADGCGSPAVKLKWAADPKSTEGYVVLKGDAKTGEFTPVAHVAAAETEYAVSTDGASNGMLLAVASALEKGNKEKYGERSIAVPVKNTQALHVTSTGLPFYETFMEYLYSANWHMTKGSGWNQELLYESRPGYPKGSNILKLEMFGKLGDGFTPSTPSNPYGLFDATDEKNRNCLLQMELCEVDLRDVDNDIAFHLEGQLKSHKANTPSSILLRVVYNGETLRSTQGEDLLDGSLGGFERYYNLPKGTKGKLSVECVSSEYFDKLLLYRLGLEGYPKGEDIAVSIVEAPADGPALGVEDFAMQVSNLSQKKSEQITATVRVNGKESQKIVIDPLTPLARRKISFKADIHSDAAYGQEEVVEVSIVSSKDSNPRNNRAVRKVLNLGQVTPLQPSKVVYSLLSPMNFDPFKTVQVKPGQRIIFTDDGGALDDYQSAQKGATMRFVPEDTQKVLRVHFSRLALAPGSRLAVYTTDVPSQEEMPNVDYREQLTDASVQNFEATSDAKDRGLTFHFSCFEPGEGWIAEITEIDRVDPIGIKSVFARQVGTEAQVDVPVVVSLTNRWGQRIEGITLTARVDGQKKGVTVADLSLAPNETREVTVKGLGELSQREVQKIQVNIQCDQDGGGEDNRLEAFRIYDRYCIPSQVTAGGLTIEKVGSLNEERKWENPSPDIAYNEVPIPLFRNIADQKLNVTVAAGGATDYSLAYWIDWDDDGTFTAAERGKMANEPSGSYAIKPTIPAGAKPEKKRMRIAVGNTADLQDACFTKALDRGCVRDLVLELRDDEL